MILKWITTEYDRFKNNKLKHTNASDTFKLVRAKIWTRMNE